MSDVQRVESYGLRGIVDEAAAARRERLAADRRRALAEDVERVKAAKRAGVKFVPTPPKPADGPRADRTPPGVHPLPGGGRLVVGEAACAADLRARRARRADDVEARLVEYATPMKRVR